MDLQEKKLSPDINDKTHPHQDSKPHRHARKKNLSLAKNQDRQPNQNLVFFDQGAEDVSFQDCFLNVLDIHSTKEPYMHRVIVLSPEQEEIELLSTEDEKLANGAKEGATALLDLLYDDIDLEDGYRIVLQSENDPNMPSPTGGQSFAQKYSH